MKKLLVLCLLASGAAYGMNETATSSGADSNKNQQAAAPAPAVASMSEEDFRREMLAVEKERLAVEKEMLVMKKVAACISILKLTDADVGVTSGAGTVHPRCTLCGTQLGSIMYANRGAKDFRVCPTCNARPEEGVSRLEQLKRIALVSLFAEHPNDKAHHERVEAALAKNKSSKK